MISGGISISSLPALAGELRASRKEPNYFLLIAWGIQSNRRVLPSLPEVSLLAIGQRQSLAKHISPTRGSAHVRVTEPEGVVESNLAVTTAVSPQTRTVCSVFCW